MREYLHGKIHRARVTEASPDYIGSITIDEDLLEKADLREHQKVLVASLNSGNRVETYIIRGVRGSGQICMNGPAAHLINVGDIVVIMGFEITEEPPPPNIVLVDDDNRFVRYL
ncbi:MAG TPA: aspartate 1-decarboxylase [Bacteroidota bacterium]|nr:aspartate 1-decarboxylase [Bacteroidota bacterium]